MSSRFEIADFGQKLTLLLRSGKTKYSTSVDLARALAFKGNDYITRIINGSRSLSEQAFCRIVELTATCGLTQADWFEPVEMFGRKLGLSATAIAQITGIKTSGIDFRSRSADEHNVRSIYRLIGGYWESFYYSVSTFGKQRISHDLVVIEAPDHQGIMPCKVIDGSFTYEGYCFPIHGSFLYFMLEKVPEHDEIIVYLVNRPERSKDTELDGIILCTSGGVQDKVAVPCAARVAFRYLGATQEAVRRAHPEIRQNADESFEAAIWRQKFGPNGYIDPTTIGKSNSRYFAVKKIINNSISQEQVPFAMRMERSVESGHTRGEGMTDRHIGNAKNGMTKPHSTSTAARRTKR